MDATLQHLPRDFSLTDKPAVRPAYDPDNLHPLDEQARRYDDCAEGIEWDEAIASTQDDLEAGRYCVWDFPTRVEMSAALQRWMDSIVEEVMHEAAAHSAHDAARR